MAAPGAGHSLGLGAGSAEGAAGGGTSGSLWRWLRGGVRSLGRYQYFFFGIGLFFFGVVFVVSVVFLLGVVRVALVICGLFGNILPGSGGGQHQWHFSPQTHVVEVIIAAVGAQGYDHIHPSRWRCVSMNMCFLRFTLNSFEFDTSFYGSWGCTITPEPPPTHPLVESAGPFGFPDLCGAYGAGQTLPQHQFQW